MDESRRSFLGAAASAAILAACHGGRVSAPRNEPRRLLILGGTGFLGPAIVRLALERGHQVTLFNRGKTRPGLFPSVEKRIGDRDPQKGAGLAALQSGEWDVVFDDSGWYPRMVGASAQLLAGRVKQYVYISSISAYKEPFPVGGTEDAPLATLSDPTVEEMGKAYENYGGLKALCEQAAERALPGKTTIVRPGYIVGPDDPTGRFTYWPVRFHRGGEIAVPGTPADPVQVIDVRDLAAWLVLLAERRTFGVFHACGPDKPMTWGRLIDACRAASASASTPIWLPPEFVAKHEVSFPIWAPAVGDTRGFHTWKPDRAVAAGLRFRAIDETVKETLAWFLEQEKVPDGRTRLALAAEDEARVLAAWKARA
jgi:2'-hydroxyisoflavone reductase